MQNVHKLFEIGNTYLHQSRAHSIGEFRPVMSCLLGPATECCLLTQRAAEILTLFFKNRVGVLSVNQN